MRRPSVIGPWCACALLALAACGRTIPHYASLADAGHDGGVDAGGLADAGGPLDAGPRDAGSPWAFQLHSTEPIAFGAVVVDAFDNVLVAGRCTGAVSLGSTPTGSGSLFLAKFRSDGTPVWARRFGASGAQSQVTALTTDANGRIFLTGHAEGGPFTLGTLSVANAGRSDVFTAAVSTDGQPVWVHGQSSPQADFGGGLALDATGRTVVVGTVDGHVSVTGISPTGTQLFNTRSPGQFLRSAASTSVAQHVGFDSTGRIIVAGTLQPGGNLGGGATTFSRWDAAFVASYSRLDGVFWWAKVFPTTAGSSVNAAGVVSTGLFPLGDDLVVVGNFAGSVNFGGGTLSSASTNAPRSGFVARLSGLTGAHVTSYTLGNETPTGGLTRDLKQRQVLTGTWNGAARFGATQVSGAGPTLVVLDAALGAAPLRALSEVRTRTDLQLTPAWVDSKGAVTLVIGAMHRDSVTFANFSPVGPSDALLVHLPP